MFHGIPTSKKDEVQDPPVYVDLTGKTTESDIERMSKPVSVEFARMEEDDLEGIMYFRVAMQKLLAKKDAGEEKGEASKSVYERKIVETLDEAKTIASKVEDDKDDDVTYVPSISWNGDLADGYMGVPIGFYVKEKGNLD